MTLDQLINAYKAVHDGIAPDTATQARLQYFVQLSGNQPSDAAAMSYIVNSADNSTNLAVLSYQFFTGKAPTQAGIDYLVNSTANPNDLNDSYYNGFNLENRYINFAANLGVQGEGAALFATKYGSLSFADYVASIYQTIIGSSYATAAGIDPAKAIADIVARKDAILATATASGMIAPNATAAQIDIALKAATAGYLLGEAIKSDVGLYASAANNFMVAVATGTATYGTDITTTYAKPAGVAGGGGGLATAPNFSFPTPVTTPTDNGTKPSVSPHAFTLTNLNDSFTGESANDTFTGILGTGATLDTTNDILNGAGGDDSLILTSVGVTAATLNPAKITNIEHLSATATGGALTLSVGAIAFADVTNHASTQNATFNDVALTSALAIDNTTFGTTFVMTPNTGLTGNTDSLTLKLTDVTSAAAVTLTTDNQGTNGYETLNITSRGTANSIILATDTVQTSLATINISGSAGMTLQFAAAGDHTAQSLRTLDASAMTGGLTVTLGAQGANFVSVANVKLGTGADSVGFVGNTAGGTGAATAATTFAKVTNFTAADKLGFSANNADFSIGGHLGLTKDAGTDLGSGAMVVQSFAQGDATAAATAGVSFIKLTTSVSFAGDIKAAFAAAIGSNGITGLGSDTNHLVSIYDQDHSQMIVAVVNVGANAGGDDNLFANDFTDASVAVVGVIGMSSGVYASFGAGNLYAF